MNSETLAAANLADAPPSSPAVVYLNPHATDDDVPKPSPIEVVLNRPAWSHMEPFKSLPAKVVTRDDYDPFDNQPTGQAFALILFKQGKARRVCISRQVNGLFRCWAENPNTKVGSRYISTGGVADMTVAQVGQFLAEVVAAFAAAGVDL